LALAQQGQPVVTHLATAQDKLAALVPLAEALGLPLTGVAAEALAAASTTTRSVVSLAARDVGSVAEASALAAAGAGARLLGPRHISP
ncbi:cobalamin biosynthesis protein, partial [Listeria monocytogenes]|uniref:cobalamin biosynthesis protein n=1 Tax=Listeria monocytogenes TaxID=1639 RepID=UPI003FA42E69